MTSASLRSVAPEPAVEQSASCPTCSARQGRTGLCLDCAERQALQEEATAPLPPVPLQLNPPSQAPSRVEHPTEQQFNLPSTSGSQEASLAAEPAELEETRQLPGRVSFAISRSSAPQARRRNDQTAGYQPRKRRAVEVGASTGQASNEIAVSRGRPLIDLSPIRASASGSNFRSEEADQAAEVSLAAASTQDNTVPCTREASATGARMYGSARQHDDDSISRLAAERLRDLLGEAAAQLALPAHMSRLPEQEGQLI